MDLSRVLTSLLLLLCVDVTTSLDGNALVDFNFRLAVSLSVFAQRFC